MSTLFTKIINNEIDSFKVYENNQITAILDVNPINEGHLLVIPHEEVDDIFNLSASRYHELWEAVAYLSNVLRKAFSSPRVGIAVEGFGVPHTHVHLVPLFNGNELNPERAKSASAEELKAAFSKINLVIKS